MIVQALVKVKAKDMPLQRPVSTSTISPAFQEKIFKPHRKIDKRYLVVVMPVDGKLNSYVYDVQEQRLVYKSISTKTIEETYNVIYQSYKKSDTKVVDPEILLGVIKEVEAPQVSFTFISHKKLAEELIASQRPQPESFHIRKVRETYKFIDKYKVKLQVEIKHYKEKNCATVYLFDEEAGVCKGTHRLEYDYANGVYKYFYCEELIISSNELENIFK